MYRRSASILARRPADTVPASGLAAPPDVHPVLRLQQTLGNRAVQRMLHLGEEEPAAPQPQATPQPQAAPDAPAAETAKAPAEAPPATPVQAPPETQAAAPPPLGHTPAPPGMAACPEVPPLKTHTLPSPATTGPLELPVPSTVPFGGDPDRARFARELARCRASRVVKQEVEKRFQNDLTQTRKRATEEAKGEKAAAIEVAAKNPVLSKKDKARAATDAEKAAQEKIAAAVKAVTRQDPARVADEVAAEYEQWYVTDYAWTLQGALKRYGPEWRANARGKLDAALKRITTEKNAKPKVPKGQAPPPAKTAEQINAEIEKEMVTERRQREEALLNVLEEVSFAWAVGRREQADFLTIPQKVAYQKNFAPTYEAAKADWVEIPPEVKVKSKEKQPGIAVELADFLKRLAADPATPRFQAGNYGNHGVGAWEGKGFSVDLYLQASRDKRGFYDPAQSVDFLLSIDRTAKALGARWQVVYNDFGVAQKVNSATGLFNVVFQGSLHKGLLNWHGPEPLILHFHLDLEIKQAVKPAQPPLPDGGVCESYPDGGACWGEP